jgi:hypothetical protein
MDPKTLADALTTLLAPALPFLLRGGTELVEEAGKTLGEEGVALVRKLWGKLRSKVEEKPATAEAAVDVARAPEDADALAALRLQLRKLLEAEPVLTAELARLVETAPQLQAEVHGSGTVVQGHGNVVAGPGGIAAGRDVRGKE